MKPRQLGWVFVPLLAACAGGAVQSMGATEPPGSAPAETRERPAAGDRYSFRSRGSATAPVTVFELSDFQCRYCRAFALETYPEFDRLYVQTGRVRYVMLNTPRPQHKNAVPAAEVAMCSAGSGKFWELHDALFREQARWAPLEQPEPAFREIAAEVGVDWAPVARCVRSGEGRRAIDEDQATQAAWGLPGQGVPTFIVDGQVIARGALKLEDLAARVDSVIARKGRR